MQAISKKILFLASLVIIQSCSKKSSDEASTDEASTAANALALAEASPSQSMNLATTAVKTFESAVRAASGSLAIELVEEEEQTNVSKWCTKSAEPLADADSSFTSLTADERVNPNINKLSSVSKKWAARKFHCIMRVDGSSESIRGLIALPKGVLCAINAVEAIDFSDTGTKEMTVDVTAKGCFSKEFIADMGDDTTLKAKRTLAVDDSDPEGYTKSLTLEFLDNDGLDMIKFYFHNSQDMMGVKIVEGGGKTRQSVSAFSLNKDGVLRVDAKDYRLDPANGDNRFGRVMRLLSVGKMSIDTETSEAKFSSFEQFKGVYGDMGLLPNIAEEVFYTTAASITGTPEGGFLTKTYTCNREGSHSAETGYCDPTKGVSEFKESADDAKVCVPAGKKCDGLKAIEMTENAEIFMLNTNSETLTKSPKSWGASLKKPLLFDDVDFSFEQK